MNEKLYSIAGPFIVECEGSPFVGIYRCWLAGDPDKKVLFEGNAQDLENYFESRCALTAFFYPREIREAVAGDIGWPMCECEPECMRPDNTDAICQAEST